MCHDDIAEVSVLLLHEASNYCSHFIEGLDGF